MPFSDVYNRLVKDDNDIQGQVAYCIYKRLKQEFIRKMQSENGTVLVPDEILEEFYASQTDYTLKIYRGHAGRIIREFLDEASGELIAKEKQKLASDYLSKYHKLANHHHSGVEFFREWCHHFYLS